MKYNRFEELPVWKAAIELAVGVFKLTSHPIFRRYYSVRNQLERSAMSVSNNIAEGFESRTEVLFLDYLGRAKGSAGELRAQFYVAHDAGYISADQLGPLQDQCAKCSSQISRFMEYLKRSNSLTSRRSDVRTFRP